MLKFIYFVRNDEKSLFGVGSNIIRGLKIIMTALLMVWICVPIMGQDIRTEETKAAFIFKKNQ